MKLQLAMDMYDENLYWDVLEKTHDLIDLLELGNIGGRMGTKLICDTREKYPDLVIVWDQKATHFYPCMGACDDKPDFLSFTTDAEDNQIEKIVKLCREKGVGIIGDMYVGHNGPEDVQKVLKYGCDQISFHPNADSTKYPMGDVMILDYAKAIIGDRKIDISAYGGMTRKNVRPVLERKPDIIVIGQDIWNVPDPRQACIEWRELMKEYE